MRILIIRHADPYYPTDSLTEKGQREAELLSEKLKNEGITHIYVSPHGRAKLTAKPTAEKIGIEPVVLDWLREFPAMLNIEYNTDYFKNMHSPWNMPPELWTEEKYIYDNANWKQSPLLNGSKVVETYEYVCDNFDKLLAHHGFERNGGLFNITEKGNDSSETIALFCHSGLGTSLIAHILNMPLIAVWNSVFLPPSSVTTLYMEQHIKARPIAHGIFAGIGDTSHLFAGKEPVSCSGLHAKELK
ncbi:MAG: histidine phosphatase family protein [Ruminococcaceae bacterium]|nr:histidine phosphatase family protein [Oscillospiraceae bacterium]